MVDCRVMMLRKRTRGWVEEGSSGGCAFVVMGSVRTSAVTVHLGCVSDMIIHESTGRKCKYEMPMNVECER